MIQRVSACVALALALAVAGCSGGESAPGVASAASGGARPSPTPSLSNEQKAINYVKCIREHGIRIADPRPDGGKVGIPEPEGGPAKGAPGFDAYQQKVTKAQQACAFLAPPGSAPDAPLTAEGLANERAYAKCMRQHGVDYPDPVGNQPPQMPPGFRLDPKVQAAMKACEANDRRIPPAGTSAPS